MTTVNPYSSLKGFVVVVVVCDRFELKFLPLDRQDPLPTEPHSQPFYFLRYFVIAMQSD
jgi:hypothetical protein